MTAFSDEELQRIADGPKFAGAADLARELLETRKDARLGALIRSHIVTHHDGWLINQIFIAGAPSIEELDDCVAALAEGK